MEKEFNIFKIEYDWHEGEHGETFLGKKVEKEQFEKDLLEAGKFAESLKGKKVKAYSLRMGEGYAVECLPEFYEQISWYLTNKLGYIECQVNDYLSYDVDDWSDKKITLMRKERKTERTELK